MHNSLLYPSRQNDCPECYENKDNEPFNLEVEEVEEQDRMIKRRDLQVAFDACEKEIKRLKKLNFELGYNNNIYNVSVLSIEFAAAVFKSVMGE